MDRLIEFSILAALLLVGGLTVFALLFGSLPHFLLTAAFFVVGLVGFANMILILRDNLRSRNHNPSPAIPL